MEIKTLMTLKSHFGMISTFKTNLVALYLKVKAFKFLMT